MTHPRVRAYRPSDAAAIRRICCETAFYGRSIPPAFSDPTFIADALVGYYLTWEPTTTWVADADGQVVGYLTGCLETRRYERLFLRRVVPRLVWRALACGHWRRGALWQLAVAGCRSAHRWARHRPAVLATYPAHCHLNVDAAFRHVGAGAELLKTFLAHLRSLGVAGVHIVTATEPGRAFFATEGFMPLATYEAPAVLGVPPRLVWVMGKRLT